MILFRKFFDISTPDVAAPSIARLMATQGVFNTTENPIAQAIDIQEKPKEQQTATNDAPAETATTSSEAGKVQESPTPIAELPKETNAPIEQPKVVQQDWQEVLKQQQPNNVEVLKALGYDDKLVSLTNKLKGLDDGTKSKMVSLFETWANNGNVKDYLRELETDYTKMPAEDVMRHQLKQEYPRASGEQLEGLFQDEIVERFKLDPEKFTEDEVKRGMLLLHAKADKYRDTLTDNQQNYLFPKPPEAKPAEPDTKVLQAKQEVEAYQSHINNDQYTKSIFANKEFTIGEGEEQFKFPIDDPKALTDILFDNEKMFHALFKETDTPQGKRFVADVEHQMLVAAVAKYGKSFLSEYATHLKSLGGKAAIAPIENASKPEGGTPSKSEAAPQSPTHAMATQGRIVQGGY